MLDENTNLAPQEYPNFAFDMHTRKGKQSIAQFEKQCREWLRAARVLSTENLIFTIEGGVLDSCISSPSFDRIRDNARQAEVFGHYPVSEKTGIGKANSLLSTLNNMRRQARVKR